MGTLKIGSAKNMVGVTIDPRSVLFNDNNVKYIKRDLTEIWSYIKPLVPTLTSNNGNDGGSAFASSVYTSSSTGNSFPAWKAFDGKMGIDDVWHSNITTTGYIGYKFTTPTCVKKFSLTNRIGTSNTHEPKEIMLMGSNDGTTWVEVSGKLINTNGSGLTNYFEIDNNNSYLQYRLDITSSYGTSIVISELQFYGSQLRALIPTMTSDTTPSGEISASSYYNNEYITWYAFDNNNSTAWISKDQTDTIWVQYKFNSPKKATSLKLASSKTNNAGQFVKAFDLLGSNNGDDFELIYSGENTTSGLGVTYYHTFDNNNKAYQYYRLVCKSNFASASRKQIGELQLYG